MSVIGALAALAALSLLKAYGFGRREPLGLHLGRVAVAVLLSAAAGGLVTAPFAIGGRLVADAGLWVAVAAAALLGLHASWWLAVRRWRANGRLTPNIVVVGATGAAERLIASTLKSREAAILGVFDDRGARRPEALRGVPVLGTTSDLLGHRIMPYVDRVVITVPARAQARVRQLIERLRVLPNEITLLLDGEAAADEANAISRVADVPLAHISGPPTDGGKALMKRAQDLVIGTLALMVAAPVMALIALAIRLDSPGPVLFRQRRHGFNNEEIVVWKFRSMRVEAADATASRQVTADDDRVTRVGRIIRRTSLDELPQILNVLKGEMSLVGPRPHAIGMKTGEVESARLVAEYAHRHRMKPGMTGWAAIKGSRGPVDTPELVKRRVALDVEYIERQSFWFDLYIIAMTIPCLLGDDEAVR
jgi:Undecaprenyl-phosphate glucose phosphotransferase